MMSFLELLKSLNNDQLPSCSNPPQPVYLTSQSNSLLIPFYIHLIPEPTLQPRIYIPSPSVNNASANTSPSTVLHQSSPAPHELLSIYDIHQQTRDASQPIGFLRTQVIQALIDDNEHRIESHCKPCWKLFYPSDSAAEHKSETPHQTVPYCVCFEDWINFDKNRIEHRNEHLDRLVRGWKEKGLFHDQLSGWRKECYSIYGPKDEHEVDEDHFPGENVAFKIERAAVGLFGFLSFGVHLTAYKIKNGEYFFWIPTRSPNKPTWPSKLDNTVAGGITSGETPMETILRESIEEASFPEEFVRSKVKSTGLISYTHRNQFGWIQPEIQYTFDLECLPGEEGEIIPKPNDGETQDFKLMSTEEIFIAIKLNQFKPNCAAVLIDFFIRHGILHSSNLNHFCLISTLIKSVPNLPLP